MAFDFKRWWTRFSFNVRRRRDFYTDLAAFDRAGIPPYQAIQRVRQVARPRRSLKWLVRLLNPVIRAGGEGAGIAQAMRPWIPAEEAAMLAAGEKGGHLADALSELSGLLAKRLEIRAALKKNLLLAGIMMVVLIGLMWFILKTVLAQATTLVTPEVFAKLEIAPGYIAFGQFFLKWLWLIAILATAIGVGVSVSLPRWKPSRVRMWLDRKMVPWSLYARVQASFFLISAAAMMRAGQPFRAAAEDIQRFAAPWAKTYVRRMLARLAGGQDEVHAMQVGMLPWDVEDRLTVYAMLPEFREVMQATARDSMGQLLRRVDLIGNIIRVSIMAILALFIIATLASLGEISMGIQESVKNIRA